jgi:hypothetical protein
MKTYLSLATGICLIALIACDEGKETASETEANTAVEELDSKIATPNLVIKAFQNRYQNVSNLRWSQESDDEWEAEFTMNEADYTANFNAAGIWIETEKMIQFAEVPHIVKDVLEKEFAGYKVDEAETSETEEGLVYEFEMENESKHTEREVAISPDGKVIKNEILEDDADKNSDAGDDDENDEEDDGNNEPENN